MNCLNKLTLLVGITLASIASGQMAEGGVDEEARLVTLPMAVPDFRLADYTGKVHQLTDYADSRLIVLFLHMNGCPIVRQSLPYIEELRQEFEKTGVTFLLVNCNQFDDAEMVAEEATEFGVKLPILMDRDQVFAQVLDVRRSAETIVVDPKSWNIVYRGMADDRFDYGMQRPNPTKFWLRDILSGKMPTVDRTVTKGCLIDIVELTERATFEGEVQPVLARNCLSCHADSDAAPQTFREFGVRARRQELWDSVLLGRNEFAGCGGNGKPMGMPSEDLHTVMAWLGSRPQIAHITQNTDLK